MSVNASETPADEVALPPSRAERRLLVAAFSRVKPVALGLAAGIVSGLALFTATGLLLIAAIGQPADYPVGPHLGLLSNFLPAYDVTWAGALLGLGYGAVVGFVAGALLGSLLNLGHTVYVRMILRRLREGVIDGAI